MTATLGTFDVAATVDRVDVKGEGAKHMTLSSPVLSALNRQLQFVTYTNTVFHPKTADTGKVCMWIPEFHPYAHWLYISFCWINIFNILAGKFVYLIISALRRTKSAGTLNIKYITSGGKCSRKLDVCSNESLRN